MIDIFIKLIDLLSQALILVLIVSTVLSYFMAPYHPVRRALDQIVEPLLTPIRRIVPNAGMFDLSPLVLLILIQVIAFVLKSLLTTLR